MRSVTYRFRKQHYRWVSQLTGQLGTMRVIKLQHKMAGAATRKHETCTIYYHRNLEKYSKRQIVFYFRKILAHFVLHIIISLTNFVSTKSPMSLYYLNYICK